MDSGMTTKKMEATRQSSNVIRMFIKLVFGLTGNYASSLVLKEIMDLRTP